MAYSRAIRKFEVYEVPRPETPPGGEQERLPPDQFAWIDKYLKLADIALRDTRGLSAVQQEDRIPGRGNHPTKKERALAKVA